LTNSGLAKKQLIGIIANILHFRKDFFPMLRTKGMRHTQHSLKLRHFSKYFFLNLLIHDSHLLICQFNDHTSGGWLGCKLSFVHTEDREWGDDGLLRLVRYPSKLSLIFGWFLQRETSVSGIECRTEAYEVIYCAYLHKICRCDDASVWDIFNSPSNCGLACPKMAREGGHLVWCECARGSWSMSMPLL
jgi:hypothetical protein